MRRAVFVAVLMAPSVALAEESGGMPQFAFGNPLTMSQVIWMVLIFAALYAALAAWALPKVSSVLEERAGRISGDLDAAKAAKAEADKAVAELAEAIRAARAEAQAGIAAATHAAREAASRQAAVLNQRLEGELKAAEARIAEARNSAMRALGEAATDTARAMVERLTGRAPAAATLESAIGRSLAAYKG